MLLFQTFDNSVEKIRVCAKSALRAGHCGFLLLHTLDNSADAMIVSENFVRLPFI